MTERGTRWNQRDASIPLDFVFGPDNSLIAAIDPRADVVMVRRGFEAFTTLAAWNDSKMSAGKYGDRSLGKQMVPMADGVRLATLVYLPSEDANGPFPTILVRTPYGISELIGTLLIRDGMAWVGVSAQFVGVEGGAAIPGLPGGSLKAMDPVRYGSLHHPGDSFSYDIFSQVGQVIRQPAALRLLGDLKVKTQLACGESQSGFRLVTYVNGIDPLAQMYDGFLVHSRGGNGAPLSQVSQPAIAVPTPAFIRNDVRVPVLTFQTETDLVSLGFLASRQTDSDRFRLWEVAGTAHYDAYGLNY